MLYLIHIDPPYQHARHYLGFTDRATPDVRFQEHLNGQGSKLLRAAVAAGHELRLVLVLDGDRKRERQLKRNGGHGVTLCPECRPGHLAKRRVAAARRVHMANVGP